jgi:guanine deaminase
MDSSLQKHDTGPVSGLRGHLVWCGADPASDPGALRSESDGLILFREGKIVAIGPAQTLGPQFPAALIMHYPGRIIAPGFIDAHVHMPQVDVIASPATGLLPWLENYTFPAEARFADSAVAQETVAFFIKELLRNGTTTAAVYGTVHPGSVDAVMLAAQQRNMRLVAGKVLMDRHAPANLIDASADEGARQTEALINRWHGKDRLGYAVTVRFAGTSTPGQMHLARELMQRYPDIWLQTHVAENTDEIDWVMALYPGHRSYLDIYARFGLLRPRAVLGHCIHFDDGDWACMKDTGAAVASCPTSNFFLGSGLFDFARAATQGVPVGLATDVGGGTSFSMLSTMHSAYTAARMRGHTLSPAQLLYLATGGGAHALGLQDRIGSFALGMEADCVVLNPQATPLLARRTGLAKSLEEVLFALMVLGDDRAVEATVIAGVAQ